MNKKQLVVGLTGTTVTALCCFTPLLSVVSAAIGVSILYSWLDYLLIPALLIFIMITVHALVAKN